MIIKKYVIVILKDSLIFMQSISIGDTNDNSCFFGRFSTTLIPFVNLQPFVWETTN